jgi:hypothetical protein
MMAGNGLGVGEVGDFGAQNCQHTTKVDARQHVQLTTLPAIEPNACYRALFIPLSFIYFVNSSIFKTLSYWLFTFPSLQSSVISFKKSLKYEFSLASETVH